MKTVMTGGEYGYPDPHYLTNLFQVETGGFRDCILIYLRFGICVLICVSDAYDMHIAYPQIQLKNKPIRIRILPKIEKFLLFFSLNIKNTNANKKSI